MVKKKVHLASPFGLARARQHCRQHPFHLVYDDPTVSSGPMPVCKVGSKPIPSEAMLVGSVMPCLFFFLFPTPTCLTRYRYMLPTLPEDRAGGAAAVVGNTLYFMGGGVFRPHLKFIEDFSDVWALQLDDLSAGWRYENGPRHHFAPVLPQSLASDNAAITRSRVFLICIAQIEIRRAVLIRC